MVRKLNDLALMVAEILLQPWLREVGVVERRPVRTSRDVTSGRSSRPRHLQVLYFPHRHLWTMEYSCKVWCKPYRRRLIPRQHSRHSWRLRLVAFDHRTLDEALSAACRQEGEMEQYLEENKASQKRPAATFQRQDKKKMVYQTPQRSVTVGSSQVPSVRSPGVKKECPHCGKTHGGTECWMITDKCLKCGSSDHKIKDCPRLQQGVQRGSPAPAVAAAAPATGRPGRPRAPARTSGRRPYWRQYHDVDVVSAHGRQH
ncbi:hypothetical protein Taro_000782 [Colocasia esculenta]|uniref:CCHC-type domain-containing protein n=1 Tax=Colocasia esculenta TaxID=4460 RepID=A0A843TFY0_COLES|nr:hypothetical protein [Colocasia esculenta]